MLQSHPQEELRSCDSEQELLGWHPRLVQREEWEHLIINQEEARGLGWL